MPNVAGQGSNNPVVPQELLTGPKAKCFNDLALTFILWMTFCHWYAAAPGPMQTPRYLAELLNSATPACGMMSTILFRKTSSSVWYRGKNTVFGQLNLRVAMRSKRVRASARSARMSQMWLIMIAKSSA